MMKMGNRLRARRIRKLRRQADDAALMRHHADMAAEQWADKHSASIGVCRGDSAVAGQLHHQQLWLDDYGRR